MIENKEQKNYEQFLKTYNGNILLQKHTLDETGVWHVRGEDPNCDMGGSHIMPDLGYFEGRLEDVIRTAVMLPSFWQWGGGGDIKKKVEPVVRKVLTAAQRAAQAETREAMIDRKAAIEAELARINKDLDGTI